VRALIEARLRDLPRARQPVRSMRIEGDNAHSEDLRQRLKGPHWRAAVLIGLIERDADMHVLLTRRATHLARHAGQVAFPGGRIEPDDRDPEAAALREAHEEIGLPPDHVEVVGRIGDHVTGTGFIITPVIGFVQPGFEATPDPTEVAGVFEVPLSVVFAPNALSRCVVETSGGARLHGLELNYAGERIWGATAAMLSAFKQILYETE
jgi:8-oxo-dGTP pyrophosphatase MutT (NUDIX family)